uniref:Uncharacterized protein n=1 Tax=Aegilops tauschii subsp. strangulata TaxID=200361 RepID=A0A453H3T2_AEGTS
MNLGHVEEEVGKLREEIQRLGQQQPDGSYKVLRSAISPRVLPDLDPHSLDRLTPASRRFGACRRSPDADSPVIARFAGSRGDLCGSAGVCAGRRIRPSERIVGF